MFNSLSQVELKSQLHYDPDTGIWTWLAPLKHSKMKPGDIAGRITQAERWQIRLAGEFYYASRLAWLYMTGEWPVDQIDHINRDRADDRWCNLREATHSQNCYNRVQTGCPEDLRGIQRHGNQYRVDVGGKYYGLYRYFEEALVVRNCIHIVLADNFATQ